MRLKVYKLKLLVAFCIWPLLSFIQEGSDSDKYIRMAKDSERAGKAHVALSYLTQALELDPRNFKAYEERGDIHLVLEQYDKAILDFESALKIEEHERLFYKLAVSHSYAGDDRECLIYIDKAMEFDFEKYEYYYYRGLSKMRMGNNEEALLDFNQAIKLHRFDNELYFHRAQVQMHLHHFKLAENDLTDAIQKFPLIPEYYYYRAECRMKLEMYKEAVADYTNCIEMSDNMDAFLGRAAAYEKLMKYDQAIADLNYFTSKLSRNVYGKYLNGVMHYKAGKFSMAEDQLSNVIQSQPENKYAYYYRGLAKLKQNKKSEACSDFEQCKKLGYDSGYEEVKDNCN